MKHGNTKYKFSQLKIVGDMISERPNHISLLKAAFRSYNKKLASEGKPTLKVIYDEFGGKRVDIHVTEIVPVPKHEVQPAVATA